MINKTPIIDDQLQQAEARVRRLEDVMIEAFNHCEQCANIPASSSGRCARCDTFLALLKDVTTFSCRGDWSINRLIRRPKETE